MTGCEQKTNATHTIVYRLEVSRSSRSWHPSGAFGARLPRRYRSMGLVRSDLCIAPHDKGPQAMSERGIAKPSPIADLPHLMSNRETEPSKSAIGDGTVRCAMASSCSTKFPTSRSFHPHGCVPPPHGPRYLAPWTSAAIIIHIATPE